MRFIFLLCCLSLQMLVAAHEGHHHDTLTAVENLHAFTDNDRALSWFEWVGRLHLIALHFPIALINMLAVSEAFWLVSEKSLFDFASQFMLGAAAIITPLTALLGWIYSYSAPYFGYMEDLLWWHMWLGILTTALVVVLALIRQNQVNKMLYYAGLVLLLILVNATSYFGAEMSFG